VSIDQAEADRSMLTLTLHEGRNRIVRRMFDAVGHPVRRLTRTSVGPVRLAGLRSGQLRELERTELGPLLDSVGL
jgi:23S rRNA pseudouridine2605 synthase